MKCKDCQYLQFAKSNGNPSRYNCIEPTACKEALVGVRMICRCDRHETELKIKTAPRWCKLNK